MTSEHQEALVRHSRARIGGHPIVFPGFCYSDRHSIRMRPMHGDAEVDAWRGEFQIVGRRAWTVGAIDLVRLDDRIQDLRRDHRYAVNDCGEGRQSEDERQEYPL